MSHIFVSHATKNDATADQFALALEKHEFATWIDHRGGLTPGAPNWDRAIREGLHAASAGVLLMSPASLASDICEAECLSLRELGKPLYVVYVETAASSDIWLAIKMIEYADCRTDFDGGITGLARALRGETAPDVPTAVTGKITGSGTMRFYLPYLLSVPLTGRDADVATIQGMLGAHVTQITAIGGMGKSRLAAEVAQGYAQGAVWHRCSPESATYQVVDLLRDHLRLEKETDQEQVLAALDGAPPLVVLDNAEDVPDDTERRAAYVRLVGQLTAHGAPLLLTSRTAWAELKPRKEHPLTPITTEEAGRVAAAFAAADNLPLSREADARALAEAARWHPRLIEFAVGQLHEREFPAVLRQLHDLKQKDVQKALDEMIRQTVRQMVEQADGGAEAERLLRRLTVFRGTFSRAALEALAPDDLDADALDDALAVLRRWRFVNAEANGRYRMELIIPAALGEDAAAYAAHYAYYKALANEHDDKQDYLGLDPNSDNLEAAFERKMAAGEYEDAYWLQNACHNFQANRGRFEQGKDWLERAALGLDAAFFTPFIEGVGGAVSPLPEGEGPGVRAAILVSLGILYREHPLGDRAANLRKAIEAYEAALVHYTPAAAPLAYAMTQNNLGIAYADLAAIEEREANLRKAIEAYEAALVYYTPTAAPLAYATTQNNLGIAYADLAAIEEREANLRQAITAYEAALVYRTPAADPLAYAMTQNNLGNAYADLAAIEEREANLRKAITAYEAALVYRTPAAAPLDYAMTQRNLGIAYEDSDDKPAAIACWREAERYYRLMGLVAEADMMLRWIDEAAGKPLP